MRRFIRIFHDFQPPLIDTAASARCGNAPATTELFQQFARSCGKLLKQLAPRSLPPHRAEAAVSMRDSAVWCESLGLTSMSGKQVFGGCAVIFQAARHAFGAGRTAGRPLPDAGSAPASRPPLKNDFARSLFPPCAVGISLIEAVFETVVMAVSGDQVLVSPACSGSHAFRPTEKTWRKAMHGGEINLLGWMCRLPQYRVEFAEITGAGAVPTGRI
jgi:hypothetical protein